MARNHLHDKRSTINELAINDHYAIAHQENIDLH